MSEFSESYHFITNNEKDVIDLLKRANLKGYIFPVTNNWCSFLPEGNIYKQNIKLIEANKGYLLHYQFAEDHGWSIKLYDSNKLISEYNCNWSDTLLIDEKNLFFEKIEKIILKNDNQKIGIIKELLNPKDYDDIYNTEPAYTFAKTIGLTYYKWLAYDYLERDKEMLNSFLESVKIIIVEKEE